MRNLYQKPKIGVMASARFSEIESEAQRLIAIAARLGEVIAERDCLLVTGATTGIPDVVSRAARKKGGLAIGISPATCKEEHVSRYALPDDGVDLIIYTGFGLKGRNVINVRSSDVVIVFGGGMGTLNEFTIAYDEGKVVGVLEGTGGVADRILQIAALSSKLSSEIVSRSTPEDLIDACLEALNGRN